ncbi:MAG: lipoprotein [Thermaurantiacus sp.]
MSRAARLLSLLLVGACGYKGPLTMPVAEGETVSREERRAQAAETDAALMLAPQARPVRVDEPLRRGVERPEDPFAPLPPGIELPPIPDPLPPGPR